MCLKKIIADYIVKPFKIFPYFGRLRFWCLYWAYRLTGWHIRNKEWDFVLEYLPKLGIWQDVSVLDVGCSRNLFCYEVIARGYNLTGVDLEIPDFKYPSNFVKMDIRESEDIISDTFDFVTCISVLEHIEGGQDLALKNMFKSLRVGGRLLLTIPTEEFAQGHPWAGFTLKKLENILPQTVRVIEYNEKAGQICTAIERIE